MEHNGFANLLENKLAVGFQIVSSQALGAPGNHDGIKKFHADTFCQLVEHHVKTMVEAPDDGCVSLVSISWRVEMQYLSNEAPRVGPLYRLYRRIHSAVL